MFIDQLSKMDPTAYDQVEKELLCLKLIEAAGREAQENRGYGTRLAFCVSSFATAFLRFPNPPKQPPSKPDPSARATIHFSLPGFDGQHLANKS